MIENIAAPIRNYELQVIVRMNISRITTAIMGLDFRSVADKSHEKKENSSGLKKLYHEWKENSAKKKYEKYLGLVEGRLSPTNPTISREFTLFFLDEYKKKGLIIPDNIQKKMDELPRTDLKDRKKLEQLLKKHYQR